MQYSQVLVVPDSSCVDCLILALRPGSSKELELTKVVKGYLESETRIVRVAVLDSRLSESVNLRQLAAQRT